jgi:hypothetical protein
VNFKDLEIKKKMLEDAKAYKRKADRRNLCYSTEKLPDNYWRFINKLIKE